MNCLAYCIVGILLWKAKKNISEFVQDYKIFLGHCRWGASTYLRKEKLPRHFRIK